MTSPGSLEVTVTNCQGLQGWIAGGGGERAVLMTFFQAFLKNENKWEGKRLWDNLCGKSLTGI